MIFVFLMKKEVWLYRFAYDVPHGDTDSKYIYGFVGLAPFFFLAKVPFLAIFLNIDGTHPMLFAESSCVCIPTF